MNKIEIDFPFRKSVEAVRRTIEQSRRRVASHLNKIDRVSEDDDDTETENSMINKQDFRFFPRRRFQRQSE